MPRDNEELGRFLAARHPSHESGKMGPCRPGCVCPGRRPGRVGTAITLLAMRVLLWCAHQLLHWTARLFFQGLLSPRQARMLMRVAARLNRASLTILRRRQRDRLWQFYIGNDNHDDRT